MPAAARSEWPGALPFLRWLDAQNPRGTVSIADATRAADLYDAGHGRAMLDALHEMGYIGRLGFGPDLLVKITDAGRQVLAREISPYDSGLVTLMMLADPDTLAGLLLAWLHDRTSDRFPERVPLSEFRREIHADVMNKVLRDMADQGFIELDEAASGLPNIALTPQGMQRARDGRERWRSRKFREQAARDRLLDWLYNQDDSSPTGAIAISGFFRDHRCVVDGKVFPAADVDRAAAYLRDKKLIGGIGAGLRGGPLRAWLTHKGTDCIEQGSTVADFLKRDQGVTFNFGNVTGSNLAWGDHADQKVTNTGVDPDGLIVLARAIMQALGALNLDAGDRQALEGAAQELETAADVPEPDKSRIKAVLQLLRAGLVSAGKQALSLVLTAAVDHALGSMGLPPPPPA